MSEDFPCRRFTEAKLSALPAYHVPIILSVSGILRPSL